MSSLRFTLYEIIGYMAPGVVGLAALSIVFWAAFLPQHAIEIANNSHTKEELALFLFAAYTIGHLVQGLCNYHPSPEKLAERRAKHAALISNARAGLSSRCSMNLDKYDLGQIVALAQTYLLHTGKTEDHEIFLYREGFYRGSSASYALLGVALLFRVFRGETRLVMSGATVDVSPHAIVFLSLISILISVVFYQRYIRFSNYRLQNLLNIACMPKADSTQSSDANKPKDESGG